MLNAISHIALVVADPARTAGLFETLFGARPVQRRDDDGHDETFIKLGATWFALVQVDVVRPRTGDHIAFRVSQAELAETVDKLKTMDMEFVLARSDTSLYFFDYDNHVFELDAGDVAGDLGDGD